MGRLNDTPRFVPEKDTCFIFTQQTLVKKNTKSDSHVRISNHSHPQSVHKMFLGRLNRFGSWQLRKLVH